MDQENKKIDFKPTVLDRKLCSITMDVEISQKVVADEIKIVFNQIQHQVKIGGFRQGKVPMNIVKEKFSNEAKNRVVENIVKKTVLNALEEAAFIPIDFPIVEEFDYELGQALKYRFTAECDPVINIKDYKGIPVKKEIFKITDKSLSQSLDALREENAKLVPSKSCEVTENSFVFVDYIAFDSDGKALSEINAKNHMLDLSSKNTIKDFKDALKGAKIGDGKDVKIEYCADYPNRTLAGKTITFKTKVVEIKEKELPELDDDFAKDMGVENLEDFKTKVKETIEAEEKRRQDTDVERQIVDYLLEKNKFEVPQSMVAIQKKSLIKKLKGYMKAQGDSKEYIEKQEELGQEKFKEEAEKNVRLSYILNAIYTIGNFEVTEADIEAKKNKIKASNPDRNSVIIDKYFAENEKTILFSLKEEKVFGFLLDNAKITIEEKNMPLKKD
ncbi:MAG: trigger factor [Endomicrobium sp.]|jgi:trigger factor|nr:trigger factor [Endomicrobium sp.]